jgi:palmitoyl-protein thioesterase
MHGLGDAGSNAGMQSLAATVRAAHPGAYAVAVDVANTVASFVTPIKLQIEELAAAIRADATLRAAPEINLVGLSQGGLVIRGYAQRFAGAPGYPRVKSLVSICGVQNGVFNCPAELQIVRLTRATLRPLAAPATATLTTLKPNPTRAPRRP